MGNFLWQLSLATIPRYIVQHSSGCSVRVFYFDVIWFDFTVFYFVLNRSCILIRLLQEI